jgi:hypothetical protein
LLLLRNSGSSGYLIEPLQRQIKRFWWNPLLLSC